MAYTDFYVQTTGSNLNAGSTTADAAVYTSTNGNWDGTSVFTPTDGSTPANTVSAGNFASVFLDAASVTPYIAKVASVAAGVNGAITLSTTNISGTPPSSSATGRSIKVGGAWKGPNATVGFPFGTISSALSGNPPRINFKAGTTYSITANITHNVIGTVYFQGYTTSVGDGGRFILDGGTAGASYILLTFGATATSTVLRDAILQNNGATGSASGLTISALGVHCERVTVNSVRGAGFDATQASSFTECEAYSCNQSNTSGHSGYYLEGGGGFNLRRCTAHHNTGNVNDGFNLATNAVGYFDCCVAASNGRYGFFSQSRENPIDFSNCDAVSNTSDGYRIDNSGHIQTVMLDNCNSVSNGGFGWKTVQGNVCFLRNCGDYNNTSGRSSGGSVQDEGAITYTASPYNDAANGDFGLNNTASAGAAGWNAARANLTEDSSQYSKSTTSYKDVGASRHQDPPGPFPIFSGVQYEEEFRTYG